MTSFSLFLLTGLTKTTLIYSNAFYIQYHKRMPARGLPKGETRLLFSLTSYTNMERNSNISCGNSVACASESYEKYVFQNLILLQVLRALTCPHFLPGRCLRGGSESTPCPCCSGGMGLRFRSRIWAQRLNQIQQRCLIP